MDADLHVAMFGRCIQNTATLHLVTYPINEIHARERSCLGNEQWTKCHPTHALTGVGVLAKGHRFFEQANRTDYDVILERVMAPLRDLVKKCTAVSQKYSFFPIADICNHLILVDNPALPRTTRAELEEGIRTVNNQLLNVNAHQLHDIPALLLVAGGKKKAGALRQILNSSEFKTRIICIDQALAREITRD
jgi:hypothetical protein